MKNFLSVDQARNLICQQLVSASPESGDKLSREFKKERVFLTQALGRILAESVVAPHDAPSFSHSARDGFALRTEDLGDELTSLNVVGLSAAGRPMTGGIQPGQAARIMTGAKLPDGANAVVMQENCDFDEDTAILKLPRSIRPAAGAWVRRVGEDMARGEVIVKPGMRLGAAEIGLLAGLGRSLVTVTARPRVAIVSTGDELVDPGQPRGEAQIINSNAYLLAALVAEFGGEPSILPIAPDDASAIRQTFESAVASADLVLSSGGVSVGDFDITRTILDEITQGMAFWKVCVKPGKPLAFGVYTRQLAGREQSNEKVGLLGLPGNPNACFVGFHQFVRPAMDVIQGVDSARTAPITMRAVLSASVKTTPRRRVYLGGCLRQPVGASNAKPGELPVFEPFENQNSGNLRLFCQANAFGVVPEGVAELNAGEGIAVELMTHR